MGKQFLISVIIPTYNTGYLLENCLKSLINQTYENIEILICDDFTDDFVTKKIIDKYRSQFSSKVRYLKADKKGANFAREIGFRSANGEYLTFVDSDDSLTSCAIGRLVDCILRDDSDIVIGKLLRVDSNNNIINDNITPLPKENCIHISFENINNYDSYLKPTLCGKLYTKSLFNEIVVENPPYFQDWNITYKLLFKVRKISFLHEFIYLYTYNENSFASGSTKANQEKINDSWVAINGIMSYFSSMHYYNYKYWMQYITFNFLISLIGRSHYLDSIIKRKEIHRQCLIYWKNNFKESHYQVNQKWFWKVSLSSFMFSEIIRVYYTIRKKMSKYFY